MKNNLNKIVSLIFIVKRLFHEQITDEKGKSFSFLQLNTLRFIKQKKPLMKEIADYLSITPPSATSLVDTLIRLGLVKRVLDRKDRRMVKIAISRKGARYLKESFDEVGKTVRKKLEILTEKEQRDLAGILAKIVESLNK
ncbi:MAG: MarR family transcriptional regulator [Candidatus Moranbacteria bacterium]|nr:MarR family transcriptional regulator [Candidatus Moranbacteria bacterium]